MSKGPWKKKAVKPDLNLTDLTLTDKPRLPPVDQLAAAQEAARHAQEGNRKLALSVDALRKALETIVVAEVDRHTGLPVTLSELRTIALGGLDAYSALTGQSWRRHKIVETRVGGTGNPVTPENMAFG